MPQVTPCLGGTGHAQHGCWGRWAGVPWHRAVGMGGLCQRWAGGMWEGWGQGGEDRISNLESSYWVAADPAPGSAQPIPWDRDPCCCLASQPRDSSAGALGPSLTPPSCPVPRAVPAALGGLNRGAAHADPARAPAGLPAPRCVGTGAGYVPPGPPRTHRARHTPRPSGCAGSLPHRAWLATARPGLPAPHWHAILGRRALGTALRWGTPVLEGVPGTAPLREYRGHGTLFAIPWVQHVMCMEPERGG